MGLENTVIINFATANGWYLDGQKRLKESVATFGEMPDGLDVHFLGFNSETEIGSPSHTENPYAFKVYCFMKALELGYRKIIYCDSSLYATKPRHQII